MSKRLLYFLNDAKEAEAAPPPAMTSSFSAVDGDCPQTKSLSDKEPILEAYSSGSEKDLSIFESTTDALSEVTSVDLTISEKSSTDFIVTETSKCAVESKEKNDSVSLEDRESIKKESSESGEIVKPEKVKKMVRLQSNENMSDNVNLPKTMSLKPCPSVGTNLEIYDYLMRSNGGGGENNGAAMMEEAWERLKKSYVYFKGKPVGTFAAMDPMAEALNYNQVNLLVFSIYFFLFILYEGVIKSIF